LITSHLFSENFQIDDFSGCFFVLRELCVCLAGPEGRLLASCLRRDSLWLPVFQSTVLSLLVGAKPFGYATVRCKRSFWVKTTYRWQLVQRRGDA